MMSRDERLDEIFCRAREIRRRRESRRTKALGGMTAALSLGLVALIGLLAGRGTAVHGTSLGAFLLGPEAGGYVIVALLAFALGIGIAVLSMRKKRSKNQKTRKTDQ